MATVPPGGIIYKIDIITGALTGVRPADTPPSSQATGQEMRSLPKKADRLPASEFQKTNHSLSNICVHCEEIYNKKKGSHADIPGSISLKVIPSAAMKGSQDVL